MTNSGREIMFIEKIVSIDMNSGGVICEISSEYFVWVILRIFNVLVPAGNIYAENHVFERLMSIYKPELH